MRPNSENGLIHRVVQSVYDTTIRDYLPKRICVYRGVPARGIRLLDMTDHQPEYKKGLIDSIYEYVSESDNAVMIGAGRGITSTHLARAGATVTAYEAAEEMLSVARETLEMSQVSDQVTVVHKVVGEGIKIRGMNIGSPLPPAELETGDILVMDCEGAERSILNKLNDWPQMILVETHPNCGVPTSETREILEDKGYNVETRQHKPNDDVKKVLVAINKDETK